MRGPIENALSGQVSTPGGVGDIVSIDRKPSAHQIFSNGGGNVAILGRRQITQPCKAVHIIGKAARPIGGVKTAPLNGLRFPAPPDGALQHGQSAFGVAKHRIFGNG